MTIQKAYETLFGSPGPDGPDFRRNRQQFIQKIHEEDKKRKFLIEVYRYVPLELFELLPQNRIYSEEITGYRAMLQRCDELQEEHPDAMITHKEHK